MSAVDHTYAPEVGEMVRDILGHRFGVVVGHEGSFFQLQSLRGGTPWDVEPRHLRAISQAEVLSARVADANAHARERP